MKILIIQTAYIGDSILSTALIPPLKSLARNIDITILTTNKLKEIFRLIPNINIIAFDKNSKSCEQIKLIKKLRYENFDIVICPHRSLRSALFSLLTGARMRIGFSIKLNGLFFNRRVVYDKKLHEVERFLNLLKPLGIESPKISFPFYIDPQTENSIKKILPENYIVIAPGSVWFTKRWPERYYTELISLLIKDKRHIVLIGSPDEKETCENIIVHNDPEWIYNLCGAINFKQLFAVIKNANLLISNDSAPMHIASVFNTPTATIFGSTVKEFGFTPLSSKNIVIENTVLDCRPCKDHGLNQCPKGHFKCMLDLTPQKVYSEIKSYFKEVLS